MANDFMKLTAKNQTQSQIDALKKIGDAGYGVNGGQIVFDGDNLSIFQGDVNNFKSTGLGGYNADQLGTIFAALDVDGNGKLDMNELQSFAALGEDTEDVIDNDKAIIDETDFAALFDLAQEYVEEALVEEETPKTPTTNNNNNNTNNNTKTDVKPEIPTVKPSEGKEEIKDKEQTKVEEEITPTPEPEREVQTTDATLSDNEALALASELREAMQGWGTDEAKVHDILQERGYNSADVLKIMNAFESKYNESLMSDIQGDFSGNEETNLRETLYNSAAQQAMEALGWTSTEDIPDNIVQKANEFYSQLESADATGYMKGFDKLSDSEKAQILIACDMMHPEESSVSRVTEGRAWFGKEDGYVDRMIGSLKSVANTKETGVKEETKVETPKTTLADRTSISDTDAQAAATELRSAMAGWGTDEKTVTNVLEGRGYSSADIVKIMDVFENSYGESLMSDIQGDFSGKAETVHRETLFKAAASEAAQSLGWTSIDDIPSDIVDMANDFYLELESSDATGYMKKFDKFSDSQKSQIMVACQVLHPDELAISRITEDRAWFGKEDGYVDNILRALKNTAKEGI